MDISDYDINRSSYYVCSGFFNKIRGNVNESRSENTATLHNNCYLSIDYCVRCIKLHLFQSLQLLTKLVHQKLLSRWERLV